MRLLRHPQLRPHSTLQERRKTHAALCQQCAVIRSKQRSQQHARQQDAPLEGQRPAISAPAHLPSQTPLRGFMSMC